MSKFAFTAAAGVQASVVGTGTANFANTETVVVGGKTYTFQDTLTDSDGNVHVGTDLEESIDNLFDAINAGRGFTDTGEGSGTGYADSMTKNKQVYASAQDATTVTVTACVPGTIGNLIASTETGANFSWAGATLASGTGDAGVMLDEVVAELDHMRDEIQMNADALGHMEITRAALVALSPES